MINFIIDAANEKINFAIVAEEQSYTTSYANSRENFDNFVKLIIDFFNKKKLKISDIQRIYVNLGPGKYTSLRISLSIAKAISLSNKAILIGFKTQELINKDYKNLIKLNKKKSSIKGLINPIYSS
jgi:tRNA threonylcarbamoyladenosine biosynthesis protein TsaB